MTSYPEPELCRQLAGWVAEGIPRVKMKVGRDPGADLARVRAAREAIGEDAELFVDANGAYSRKQALALAAAYQEAGVTWFEEPVSSNDLDGLRRPATVLPPAWTSPPASTAMTRATSGACSTPAPSTCSRPTSPAPAGSPACWTSGALCTAHELPFSAHCAPQIHAHAGCAIGPLRHCEYFHTHARAERILFDGVLAPGTAR